MPQIAALMDAMIQYEADCPARAQHFLKVYAFAQGIGQLEGLDPHTQFLLESAALVHDIGIRPSLTKYQSDAGPHQEAEGPPVARPMLESLGYEAADIDRICYLIAHHHTYQAIDGPDYQILVEADFLVNIFENAYPREKAQKVYDNIFRTGAGRRFCRAMYLGPVAPSTSPAARSSNPL